MRPLHAHDGRVDDRHPRAGEVRSVAAVQRRSVPEVRVRDRALSAAIDLLRRTICECGCLKSDHATVGVNPEVMGECCDCDCKAFKPAAFTVTRK